MDESKIQGICLNLAVGIWRYDILDASEFALSGECSDLGVVWLDLSVK